jgi:hypothetical protein
MWTWLLEAKGVLYTTAHACDGLGTLRWPFQECSICRWYVSHLLARRGLRGQRTPQRYGRACGQARFIARYRRGGAEGWSRKTAVRLQPEYSVTCTRYSD